MVEIGKMIRALRTRNQMTLKELADKAGISAPYLSQIENDQVNMNMSVLENLSAALDTPIYMFFLQDIGADISFVKRDERSTLVREDGVTVQQLVDQQLFRDNIVVLDIPGDHTVVDYSAHQGDEFIFILEGTACVDFSGYRVYEMHPGDSIAFSSKIPHRITSKKGCRMILRSGTYHTNFL